MESKYSAVLFDLDGTVIDSAPQITRAVSLALEERGENPVPQDQLRNFVGPPLQESFRDIAKIAPELVDQTIAVYRGHYQKIMLEAAVFPGIENLLAQLVHRGIPLAIATSKTQHLARMILEHQNLADYFTVIGGALPGEKRSRKVDVVRYVLSELKNLGYDCTSPVLIGDRIHDVQGGMEAGIPVIGTTWGGYGQISEFKEAVAVIDTPEQLLQLL